MESINLTNRESNLIKDLEMTLNTHLAKSNPIKYCTLVEEKKDKQSLQNSIIGNCSLYSQTNQELYFLSSNKDSKGGYYSLITFSTEESYLKSNSKLKFLYENQELLEDKFQILELHIHPANQNQLCFFGKNYIGFLSDVKSQTMKSNKELVINVIHCSEPKITFKLFKFSEFNSYFGVVLNDNSFRVYSIDSVICKAAISNKDKSIVDFQFGSVTSQGWTTFAVFFLDLQGGVFYSAPIFPTEFTIPKSFISNMFLRYKTKRPLSAGEEHDMNKNIITHIEQCIDKTYTDMNNFRIKCDDYLKTFNKNPLVRFLIINDKRKSFSHAILSQNFSKSNSNLMNQVSLASGYTYKQLYVMTTLPLAVLRISSANFIDVIVCLDEICPIRNQVNFNYEKLYRNNFLTETLVIKNTLLPQEVRFKILKEDAGSVEKVILNYLNNIYSLEIPYLLTFSDIFENPQGVTDLKLYNMKSNLIPFVKFNYTQNLKDKTLYGYYCAEILANKEGKNHIMLVVPYINGSFHPKLIPFFKNTPEIRENETCVSFIHPDSRFEKIQQLSQSIQIENVSKFKDDPILFKKIELNNEHLATIGLNNLEEFLKVQVEGIFKYYDSLLTQIFSKAKEKITIMTEVYSKLESLEIKKNTKEFEKDYEEIGKVNSQVLEKRSIIDKKIENVKKKLYLVQVQNKTLLESLIAIKGYFERYLQKYKELKRQAIEIKSEFDAVYSSNAKNEKLISHKINPESIDKALMEKGKIFEQNLNKIMQNLGRMLCSLDSFKIK